MDSSISFLLVYHYYESTNTANALFGEEKHRCATETDAELRVIGLNSLFTTKKV